MGNIWIERGDLVERKKRRVQKGILSRWRMSLVVVRLKECFSQTRVNLKYPCRDGAEHVYKLEFPNQILQAQDISFMLKSTSEYYITWIFRK